jgi:hypothetical protein
MHAPPTWHNSLLNVRQQRTKCTSGARVHITFVSNDAGFRSSITGLPIHPYFSALKIRWLIDNVPAVTAAVKEGRHARIANTSTQQVARALAPSTRGCCGI